MSRIIYSHNFSEQSDNFSVLYAKHKLDGDKSILIDFLIANEIDIEEDLNLQNSALLHEENRQEILKIQGGLRNKLENHIDMSWKYMLDGVQYLKKFYQKNVRELRVWSIKITANGKITYPQDEGEMVLLLDNFWGYQNNQTAGTSPLDIFIAENEIDVVKILQNIAIAKTLYKEIEENIVDEQAETGERNKIWKDVWEDVKDIGGFLMKLYVANPKKICNWGYNAVGECGKQELRTSKIKLGSTVVSTGIFVGSVLTNTGNTDLHLYKGRKIKGKPIVLHAGEHFGVLKGYSTITVINPSLDIGGKFTTMANR